MKRFKDLVDQLSDLSDLINKLQYGDGGLVHQLALFDLEYDSWGDEKCKEVWKNLKDEGLCPDNLIYVLVGALLSDDIKMIVQSRESPGPIMDVSFVYAEENKVFLSTDDIFIDIVAVEEQQTAVREVSK